MKTLVIEQLLFLLKIIYHICDRVKTEVKTEEDSEENGLEEKVDFVGFSGTENTDFTLGLLR